MIKNAKDTHLQYAGSTLPDVGVATLQWMQPMTFIRIEKQVVDFQVIETPCEYPFMGVIQTMSPTELKMKPEGQRGWNWNTIHTLPNVQLKVDDIVEYQDKKYRVMKVTDYSIYGYLSYDVVDDYTGGQV